MAKTSYGDLERQISAIIARQDAMVQKAAEAFTKAVMSDDEMKKALVGLSASDMKAVVRLAAKGIQECVEIVQAEKAEKAAAKQQAAAQEEASRPDAPVQSQDYPGNFQRQ